MGEQATIGTLFVQIAAQDAGFSAGMKAAEKTVQHVSETVKGAAKGVQAAFVRISDAERRLVAQVVGTEAAERSRASALGVTIAQLRAVDKAAKAATESARAEASAATAAALAEKQRGEAAVLAASKVSTASAPAAAGLAADRAGRVATTTDPFASATAGASSAAGALDEVGSSARGALESVAQLAAAFVAFGSVSSFASRALDASARLEAAFTGLRTVARSFGQDEDAVEAAAQSLAADGLMPAAQAAQAFKNALASGYSLEQAITLLKGLKEQAAFNRQAHYSLGEAVVATTEGIKNEQSILADATGTTTNLSQMFKEYAEVLGKTAGTLTQAERRQAAYNGFLKETARSAGDLDKAQTTLSGSMARFDTATTRASAAIGDDLAPAYTTMLGLGSAVLESVIATTQAVPGLAAGLTAAALAVSGLASALGAARVAMLALQAASGPVGLALAAVSVAVGVLVAGYTALSTASSELDAKQRALTETMSGTGLQAAVRRLSLLTDQLRESEEELADATDGVWEASATDIKLMQQRVAYLRQQIKVAEEATTTEHKLARARADAAAQGSKDASAQDELDKLRRDNLSEIERLQAEMVEALERNFGASTEILAGIQSAYLAKIAQARSEASKGAKGDLERLRREAEQAAEAVANLLDTTQSRVDAQEAALQGGDVGTAGESLERAFAEVDAARAEGVAKAKALGGDAGAAMLAEVERNAKAARDALLREAELAAQGVAQVHVEAERKVQAEKRVVALDALDRAHQGELSAVQLLEEERDAILTSGAFESEAERYRITAYYSGLIQKERDKEAEAAEKSAKRAADATRQAFSQVLSTVESVASTMASRHSQAISEMESDLEGMTGAAKREQEKRIANEKEAYRRAFYVQQAASIASIVVSTAQAVMAAMGQVPYPANLIVAGLVAAMGAAQAAVVATEKPEFHTGGEVTEEHRRRSPGGSTSRAVAAEVEVGEGVLTRSGMGTLSSTLGPDALDALNAGMVPRRAVVAAPSVRPSAVESLSARPAGSGGPPPFAPGSGPGRSSGTSPGATETRLTVNLDGRTVDRIYVSNMRAGKAPKLSREIRRVSGTRVGLDR